MRQTNRIEIALNKSRFFALSIASLCFVAAGMVMIIFSVSSGKTHQVEKITIAVVGIISILFFGFAGIAIARKIKDPSPGFIIDENGITDNASSISCGFIPWKNIIQFRSFNMANQQFIVVILNNPDELIERHTKSISKFAARKNFQLSGSPVNISAKSLKCSHDELLILLQNRLTEFRKNQLANPQ